MADSMRSSRGRSAVLGMVFGLLIALSTTPALAASTAFNATFDETTTIQGCPPNTPTNAICFSGTGTGLVTPPGDKKGEESFTGFVDPNTPGAIPGCPVDHNTVSIETRRGTLFLTTTGSDCGTFDDGTWQAFGGTRIFEGATGTGTVHTVVTGGSGTTITSKSTYVGTLTLPEKDD